MTNSSRMGEPLREAIPLSGSPRTMLTSTSKTWLPDGDLGRLPDSLAPDEGAAPEWLFEVSSSRSEHPDHDQR